MSVRAPLFLACIPKSPTANNARSAPHTGPIRSFRRSRPSKGTTPASRTGPAPSGPRTGACVRIVYGLGGLAVADVDGAVAGIDQNIAILQFSADELACAAAAQGVGAVRKGDPQLLVYSLTKARNSRCLFGACPPHLYGHPPLPLRKSGRQAADLSVWVGVAVSSPSLNLMSPA